MPLRAPMVVLSGLKDELGCDPFPAMIENSRAISATAVRRARVDPALERLDVPPAVLAALAAVDCTDLASVRRLVAADYAALGVPPRHMEALQAAGAESAARATAASAPPRAAPAPAASPFPPALAAAPRPAAVPATRATGGGGGGDGWESAPRREKKPAAKRPAARAAPAPPSDGSAAGYIFLCDRKTRKEVFDRKLFGLPRNSLRAMEKIGPSTALFLYDFRSYDLMGPMKAVGKPALDIEVGAWNGRFGAQLRFAPLQASSADLPNGVATYAVNRSTDGTFKSGEVTPARAQELLGKLFA